VAYTASGFVIGAHALALFLGGLLGLWWPLLAAVICTAATASLVAEGSGRFSLLRRVLPKSASYNLVWRRTIEAADGEHRPALGSLVVSAPLDAARFAPQR